MDMELTFWQLFGLKSGLGTAIAFGFGWWTRSSSHAYTRGMFGSFLVVFLPSCGLMHQSDPVQANRAAESFFWVMIPTLAAWLVSAVIALGFARIIKWKA
jgi:hypothetical protein